MTHARSKAFSLLELVLVLAVIAVALAAVTPSLGGWSRGMRLRNAADELVTATRWARERTVSTATVHRLVLGPDRTYRVVAAEGSVLLDEGPRERAFVLPEGVTLRLDGAVGGEPGVAFHPDGRSDTGTFILEDDRGHAMQIASASPAAGFAIVDREDAP